MCVDFPGVVVERDGDLVTVSTEGRRRRALALLYPDLALGDWVLVAAGTVISRIDADDAARLRAEVGQARGEIA